MFSNLDICEQYAMLRCCWSDLFILVAAQYDLQIDSVALAYEIETCAGMCNERKLRLKQTLANFHECLLRLRGLEEAEYACLKVMVLFSSGENKTVKMWSKINKKKRRDPQAEMFCPLDMEVRWFINVCFGSPDRDAWGTGLELSLTFTVAFMPKSINWYLRILVATWENSTQCDRPAYLQAGPRFRVILTWGN